MSVWLLSRTEVWGDGGMGAVMMRFRLWLVGWLCPLAAPRTYQVEMLVEPGIYEIREV